MIKPDVCDSYKLECALGTYHTMDCVYKLALYISDAVLDYSVKRYTTSLRGEVEADGYTIGGQVLTGFSAKLDRMKKDGKGVVVISFDSPTWENSSITARGGLVYNMTADNRAVAVIDFGKDVTSRFGPFVVEFPPATAATALIRLG